MCFGVFSAHALDRSPAAHPGALAGHQAALQANKIGEPQRSQEKVSDHACKQRQLIKSADAPPLLTTALK